MNNYMSKVNDAVKYNYWGPGAPENLAHMRFILHPKVCCFFASGYNAIEGILRLNERGYAIRSHSDIDSEITIGFHINIFTWPHPITDRHFSAYDGPAVFEAESFE